MPKPDREKNEKNPARETGGAPDADARAEQPEQPEANEQDQAREQVEQDIADALAALQSERDELEQRLLRTAADYQNYARRSEQNLQAAREQQVMEIARSLVSVLDHFDRALEVDPEKTTAKDVLSGVTMVRDELTRVLGRFDIERIEAQPGEPFDPNRHEALMRQASDEVESGHVTTQFQPGYVLSDKTIRPAQVAVAE
ncbi:MAG: nucleotide exchange factor GrpE [Phycisphaeraceae bacterium]